MLEFLGGFLVGAIVLSVIIMWWLGRNINF